MDFDEHLARSLIETPKVMSPGIWVDLAPTNQLLGDFLGSHPSIDRLQMKIHISGGGADRASFSLLLRTIGVRQRWRIYGLDWNPGGRHTNPLRPGNPYSGRIFEAGETHEHHFENRITDDNPNQFATPVDEELPDYPAAFSYFCAMINATARDDFPPPPAQRTLL